MARFANLQSLLAHLEADAIEYPRTWEVHLLIEDLLQGQVPGREQAELDKTRCEYNVFSVMFKDAELSKCGTQILGKFTPQDYAYVAERLASTENPVLRHWYAHVLWCRSDGKRQIEHARMAIESYLMAARECEKRARKTPKPLPYWLAMSGAIRNAYGLAARTKQPLANIRKEILRMAKRKLQTGYTGSLSATRELIKLILQEQKHFDKKDLAGLDETCWDLARPRMKSDKDHQVHEAIDMIDLGQKVDARLNRASRKWDLARAECYERLMGIREPGDFAVQEFCKKAIDNYRKAGRECKATALERQYQDIAGSVQLECISVPIDMTDTMARARAHSLAENVVNLSHGEVIAFLAGQGDLLPHCDDIKRMLSQGAVDPPSMYAPSVTIDDRGHPTEYCGTPEECKKREILQLFGQQLEIYHLPIMHEVVSRSIAAEKLSIDTLREYLQRSWLGKDIQAQSPTKGKHCYRWRDHLEPSLAGYFEKTRQSLANPTHIPNLILEIDSLTMKFEGMVRDLMRFASMPTFRQKGQNSGLTEERYIGNLLTDPRYTDGLEGLFLEDDLFFLRFLFSEKGGYDMRNRVAHCLLLPNEYGIEWMHLLFFAVLRLSKYDLVPPDEQVVGRHGTLVHLARCTCVKGIKPRNRMALMSTDASRREQYKPCKECRPTEREDRRDAQTDSGECRSVLVMRA